MQPARTRAAVAAGHAVELVRDRRTGRYYAELVDLETGAVTRTTPRRRRLARMLADAAQALVGNRP